jgi:hypothetical protein
MMKKYLLLMLMILLLAGCGPKTEVLWLHVISKDMFPDFDPGYRYKFGVIMRTDDNRIIAAADFELYNLVEVGDTINARVEYIETLSRGNARIYKVSDVEYLK